MIKVLIADDQPLMREGLKYILEQDKDIEITGCAGNGSEAFEMCLNNSPDVVLMDLSMPVCDGIEGTGLIKVRFPNVRVIILTTFNNAGDVVKVMKSGADGYILKDISPDKLINTVKNVTAGLKVIQDDAYENYIKGLGESGSGTESGAKYGLSGRDIEIIRLIVCGNSNKEVAAIMGVTDSAVRNAISGILGRLNLQDRTQLAVFSIKNKIV